MDKNKTLTYYIYHFTKLRRDYKKGGAPHKPILILALIDCIEKRIIEDNKIFITPDLVAAFKSNWAAFVETDHTIQFAMPFYHMCSEPFWKLIPNPGFELVLESKVAMKSFSNLNTAVNHALIDFELFELIKEKETRNIIRHSIIEKYFRHHNSNSPVNTNYINEIIKEILEDNPITYRAKVKELSAKLSLEEFAEEIFVRTGIFKREVPKIYNHTCCITGLSISATFNISMVDACHIVPFRKSHDDNITNGLALNPNMHRAFDRGLITIDENYSILVSEKFREENDSPYSIKQFSGKQILLPLDSKYYPNVENLSWHKSVIFCK